MKTVLDTLHRYENMEMGTGQCNVANCAECTVFSAEHCQTCNEGTKVDVTTGQCIAPQKCKVILYEHGSFNGWAVELEEGEYNHGSMTGKGVKNDQVSSLKVEGHEKCCAVVYEHGSFNGWSVKFPVGEYNHGAMTAKGCKNDQVSSIKLHGNGC